MKILALACLAAACATAGAEPPATKPPTPAAPPPADAPARKPAPPKGCVARGTPMFELDHKADAGSKLATSTFKIYDSGAWTLEGLDAEGKATEPKRGCYAGDDLKAVKADLTAPWKTTTAKMHCMAFSPAYTEYSVHGKLVYTRRLCNGITLDAASEKAAADLDARSQAAISG